MLGAATLFTVVVVAFLTMFEAKMPSFAQNGSSAGSAYNQEMDMKIESPFKNTMAMIRWNSAHPERIPTLMKYEPFFHTVHISMPGLLPDKDPEFHNLTHDQWPGTFTVYMQLAHTMQLILDKHPDIDGIMYYHFDAWIDPLAWAGANKHNIWFPSIVDIAPPNHGGPQFICTNDVNKYNWWGWGADFHKHAMAAAAVVDHFNLEYTVKKDEWCVGWSDIYYIPRRFFADYIFLSEIFGGFSVFHEVAIPTMVHIIDQSRRRNPATPIIDRFGDCWGSCCASNPKIEDVLWARCGHRLDYLNQPVVDAFYSRLEAEGKMLGMPLPKTRYALGAGSSLARFDSATLKALNGGQDLTHTLKDDGLHDDERADREAKAQAEKDAYLKAEQEQREKEAKAKQAEKAKELADKEGAAKANASAASGSPDHSGTPPHKAAGNETVTPKGADMKTPPPPAARLLRRSVPVAALAGLGW